MLQYLWRGVPGVLRGPRGRRGGGGGGGGGGGLGRAATLVRVRLVRHRVRTGYVYHLIKYQEYMLKNIRI